MITATECHLGRKQESQLLIIDTAQISNENKPYKTSHLFANHFSHETLKSLKSPGL